MAYTTIKSTEIPKLSSSVNKITSIKKFTEFLIKYNNENYFIDLYKQPHVLEDKILFLDAKNTGIIINSEFYYFNSLYGKIMKLSEGSDKINLEIIRIKKTKGNEGLMNE